MSYASRCTLLVARCSITSPPFTSRDRKSTRLNSSHSQISYAVFCLKKKKEHDHESVIGDGVDRAAVLEIDPARRQHDSEHDKQEPQDKHREQAEVLDETDVSFLDDA